MNNLDAMFSMGVNCNLFIAHWGARVKIRPEDLGFMKGGDVNETLFSLGQKRLINKDAIKEFITIEQRARQVLSKYSFQFGDQFAYFIPYTVVEELVVELEKHRKDYYDAIDKFIEDYPTLRDEMLDLYEAEAENIYKRVKDIYGIEAPPFNEFKDKLVHSIQDKYPRPNEVGEKFQFYFNFYKISLPDESVEAEMIDASEKAKELQEKEAARRQIVYNYRGEFEEQIKDFYGNAVQKLREATVELMQKVQKYNITDTRLEKIKGHITEFRMLNFVDDKTLADSLDSLEKLIENKSAGNIASNAELNNNFKLAINSVIETASESVNKEEFVKKFSRVVKIRKNIKKSVDNDE